MSTRQPPQQTFYVVLPAQPPEAADRARQISRLVKKEEDEIRKRLKVPTYQLFRRYARRDNAEGFRNQLHALGVDSFVISDTQVSGHLFLWGKQANRGSGGMAFQDFGDQPLYCPFDDILLVCSGTVKLEDGSTTRLIDLHRKSTPITPRIDARLFDFSVMLAKKGADVDAFYDVLRQEIPIDFDAEFDQVRSHLNPVVEKGLASFPGEFSPPANSLKLWYDHYDLRLFDVYSFLLREHTISTSEGQTK